MKTGGNAAPDIDWPDDLLGPVRSLPEYQTLRVAFSGGLDSLLLLRAVAACHPDVIAVHVNHQLQPNHQETEDFCRAVCATLSIPIVVERVTVPVGRDAEAGVEEAARHARYEVFHRLQERGDLLLMAHHGDDQVETVLFRLLRGSGIRGLAGMPKTRALGAGQLLRPWLGISRDRLQEIARKNQLCWQEDPSNASQEYDRNYLRHSILPGLKQRWPGLLQRVASSARACAESDQLNQRLAELQWQQCAEDGVRLNLDAFRTLGRLERRNLLRWWIHTRGYAVPGLSCWDQVVSELLEAADDRAPEIRGEGFCIRRYRSHLYLVPERELPQTSQSLVPGQPLQWGDWQLSLVPGSDTPSRGVPTIRVSTRRGGERVRPNTSGPSRTLKTWLQEQGVPPWERAALPLVFEVSRSSEELIAIGNLWCSDRYSGSAPAAGWRLIVARDFD